MDEMLLQEQLLDAWLKLSAVISNDRLVSGFSFNEAFVLNLLYKQHISGAREKLTATALCRQTRILKSQMNAILNSLEQKGMILRKRSQTDKRQVEIDVNLEYGNAFIQCHAKSLKLVERLLEQIGKEEGGQAVAVLNRLADGFAAVMGEIKTGAKQEFEKTKEE
ncbi:MAG: helix-turn-helix domain-containing protein [Lachnospiraceae bacterium]|nr:helix-turn-helix domain-containing protein [Lachnospiraceae bacterium]